MYTAPHFLGEHRQSIKSLSGSPKGGGEFTSFTIKLRANELETRATDAERVLQHEWCSWSLARSAQRYASNKENSLRQAPFLTSPTWISRLIPALQKPFHWLAKANVISRKSHVYFVSARYYNFFLSIQCTSLTHARKANLIKSSTYGSIHYVHWSDSNA